MSSITPWVDDMDKCACTYDDKIRMWRPEFDEIYTRIKHDSNEFQNRRGVPSDFESRYLDPVLKALDDVYGLIREDSLNSLSEELAREKLEKAFKPMPRRQPSIVPSAMSNDMMDRIKQACNLMRKIAGFQSKFVNPMHIHHSFLPQKSEESEEPEEGELPESISDRHRRQAQRAKDDRYLTPTERFANCVSCSDRRQISLHHPTIENSINQSFFATGDSRIVRIQAWNCENPLGEGGAKRAKLWLSAAKTTLEETRHFATNIIQALPDKEDLNGGSTYQLEALGYTYYAGQPRAKLHEFLERVDPKSDFLRFVEADLGLHRATLERTRSESKSILSTRRPDLTHIDDEVDRPASTIAEIQHEIRYFLERQKAALSDSTSVYSATHSE